MARESRKDWILTFLSLEILVFLTAGWIFGRLISDGKQIMAAFAEEELSEEGFSLEVLSVQAPLSKQKRVYIYHTHTYEAYEMDGENKYTPTETWRTADHDFNMVRVGAELAARLREAGIFVQHDTTDYEPPRLSTAYSRSLVGLQKAAEEGYDLYIDLHRDSYSKGNGANVI